MENTTAGESVVFSVTEQYVVQEYYRKIRAVVNIGRWGCHDRHDLYKYM